MQLLSESSLQSLLTKPKVDTFKNLKFKTNFAFTLFLFTTYFHVFLHSFDVQYSVLICNVKNNRNAENLLNDKLVHYSVLQTIYSMLIYTGT